MYKAGKATFKHKKDYEAFLLQSALDTLAYLKQRCPNETDVVEAVENDLKKILAINKSNLKKLG
jgi:hypothetical protein